MSGGTALSVSHHIEPFTETDCVKSLLSLGRQESGRRSPNRVDLPLFGSSAGQSNANNVTNTVCSVVFQPLQQNQKVLEPKSRPPSRPRRYFCTVEGCSKVYTHTVSLAAHIRSAHTGERPYVCGTCGKTFARRGSLVIHQRVHTGEKGYKCPVPGCSAAYSTSSSLAKHSHTHISSRGSHQSAKSPLVTMRSAPVLVPAPLTMRQDSVFFNKKVAGSPPAPFLATSSPPSRGVIDSGYSSSSPRSSSSFENSSSSFESSSPSFESSSMVDGLTPLKL